MSGLPTQVRIATAVINYNRGRYPARDPSQNSAPLRGGSVQFAQKDSDSREIDYTRVGLETRSFFPCVRAGRPEDIVYLHVNSGITDIAASSTAEPRSADSRQHCTVREVHCTLTGVDRKIRVNTTAKL